MVKSLTPSDISTITGRAKSINADMDKAISEILDASEINTLALNTLSMSDDLNTDQLQLVDGLKRANERIAAACSIHDVIRQHLEILIHDVQKPDQSPESDNNNEKLLAGPQVDGQGLRQQDIDDLLK